MPLERRMSAFRLETTQYAVRLIEGEFPAFEIAREGQVFFRIPAVSGVERGGEEERFSDIHLHPADTALSGRVEVIIHARSSLWQERSFTWLFFEDHIEMRQAAGPAEGAVGRCFFGADNLPYPWMHPADTGPAHHTQVFAQRVFTPKANLGNRHDYSEQTPQSLGIIDETTAGLPPFLPKMVWDQEKNGMLFCPPPLALCFGQEGPNWASVGVGNHPGKYYYHGLNYSGTLQAGAAFFVDFAGAAANLVELPVFALHFGFSEWQALQNAVHWLDAQGFSTTLPAQNPDWHRAPIFCGWAEQTYLAHKSMVERSTLEDETLRAADLATQANYERWIGELDERGIPFGTLVIDDKWQAGYGTFDVDEAKWPDMQGFIERQHSRGRRVLLWVPGHHVEGLPDEWVLKHADGETVQAVCADVTHIEYEAFLRERIRHLVVDLGVDGFKEDWIGGRAFTPDLGMKRPLYGMEFLRHFQFILYNEAHRHKPDALIETQTPHPLFRESSDVLRLNDLFFGTREVVQAMTDRARIAHIAGWELVDCDNASSTCVQQWWEYMQAQPRIGIPALYCLSGIESTLETIPPRMWPYLGDLWREYRVRNGL